MAHDAPHGRQKSSKLVKKPHVTEQTKFDLWLSQCMNDGTPVIVTFSLDLQPILGVRTTPCWVLVVDRYFVQLELIDLFEKFGAGGNIFWFPKDVLRAVSLAIS